MARQRDYAAEYASRQARAREQGFGSYWQQRQARHTADRQYGKGASSRKSEFLRSKNAKQPDRLTLYRQGIEAMRRKDFREADRIARQLGIRSKRGPDGKTLPPGRIFYYHG